MTGVFRALMVIGACLGAAALADNKVTPVDDLVVPAGLQIQEFAASPMIYSPVAVDVDLQGRVWLIEDLNASEHRSREVYSRISILEDVDRDGKADKVSYFGPTFSSIAMGIAVFDNQIVVPMAPDLIVYTDVDRNLKFEEGIDKKEIIVSGFHGHGHDHALHGVQPGPDGRWYFSHGNMGMDVTTVDGRELHASSYYSANRTKSTGKKSYDGHLYVGGVGISIAPDGREAEVIFQNSRNTHDLVVSSFGDVIHGDNDDPAHARAAWAMLHANFGYASLEDGSRSWEDSAKSWEEKVIQQHRRGEGKLRLNEGHWRQNYPGTTPPGVQWGAGAPTGNAFIEGDELGAQFRGTYLLCETVNQAVFSFKTQLKDAQVELQHEKQSLLSVKPDRKSDLLLTDVTIAPDGSLYVSDWNSGNNRRGRGGKEGAIYLITKAGQQAATVPPHDFSSTEGLLRALASPAANVRWLASKGLRGKSGTTAAQIRFYEGSGNPYHKARAVWLLAASKEPAARSYVEGLLRAHQAEIRITALRALLREHPAQRVDYLTRVAGDASPAVRREAALHLRDVAYPIAKPILKELIAGFDGRNRWYLEALGQAATGKEDQVYSELVKPQAPKSFADWSETTTMLAWRLQTQESLDDLTAIMIARKPAIDEFRLLAAGLALTHTPAKREQNYRRLLKLKQEPAFAGTDYQQIIHEFLEKDVLDKKPEPLTASYVFPKTYGKTTELGSAEEIAALTPNLANGKVKAAICMTCHRLGEYGVNFGPNLSQWGQARDVSVIIRNIVYPAEELAHGFEKAVALTTKEHRMEGIDVGYSHHAGAIRVKTVGGQIHKIGFRRNRVKIERLANHSWMPSASQLGFTNQDVRDVAEYLKTFAE